MAETLPITDNTRFSRLRKRASYDKAVINQILDAGILCHVGFEDNGHPVVLPTAYVRSQQQLIIHGAANGRFFKCLAEGALCCVTVSHLDGIVLARSAFHHSVNYRCVMLFGRFKALTELNAKRIALDHLMEGCSPGRIDDNIRPASEKELNATAVLMMDITEASAKVRQGPPNDDEKDMDLPVWAGVVQRMPSQYQFISAPDGLASIAQPDYLSKIKF
ncbi:pyridoxamine 5'-phosphate oxidase family protein [Endozoicomonas sp. SM1973]|uniref:Pyridoxamine 5'-phosphate oxidase family protein n=1 Tax=Spartinivicinus marinus TaxID=2994442 RepID=A0A853IF38_9GAMM|nr:pyridoxamine 5'-phosphate oxidase family protein [Spartinivicinus marinus]MCX4029300.1 pyridoxamine 5'-phosphate oxidase family protein [Spartinivicinus marinus]NYZ69148.1 pyridoxamine 5'-phosphate oxidase family protein [Spartinivicinus marinus]